MQEKARVLARDEMIGFDGAMFCEFNQHFLSQTPIWVFFDYLDNKNVVLQKHPHYGGNRVWFSTGQYDKTWRCWSKRPTEEEMKEHPWTDVNYVMIPGV